MNLDETRARTMTSSVTIPYFTPIPTSPSLSQDHTGKAWKPSSASALRQFMTQQFSWWSHHIAGWVGHARQVGRVALVVFVFHQSYVAASCQTNGELGGVVLEVVRVEGNSVCRYADCNGPKMSLRIGRSIFICQHMNLEKYRVDGVVSA